MTNEEIHIGNVVYFMTDNHIQIGLVIGIELLINSGINVTDPKQLIKHGECYVIICLLSKHNHPTQGINYGVNTDYNGMIDIRKIHSSLIYETKEKLIETL